MENCSSVKKKNRILGLSILVVIMMTVALTSLLPAQTENKKKLKRSESFFGIHFDFHAGKDCNEIGKNVTEESIFTSLDKVKPDFIQVE